VKGVKEKKILILFLMEKSIWLLN